MDIEPLMRSIRAQTENGLEHMKDTPGGPRLGNIGPARIQSRKIDIPIALDAREDLWWTVGVKALYRIKHPTNDKICLISQPVALETCRNNAIIMRPD